MPKHTNCTFRDSCSQCGSMSRRRCGTCANCGYCIPERGSCVPGNNRGPYFRDDCVVWEYTHPFMHYLDYYRYPHYKKHFRRKYYGNKIFPRRYYQAAYNPYRRNRWSVIRKYLKNL